MSVPDQVGRPDVAESAWETLSIADLRLVLRLARGATITELARESGYSQSAMSRRTARIERAIGHRVVRRHGSVLTVTDAGRRVAEYAARVLAAHRRALGDLGTTDRSVVELGSFTTANAWLVPSAIAAAIADDRHDDGTDRSGATFSVTEATTPRLLADVRSGGLDAAIVSDYPSGADPAPGVEFHHIVDDPLLVALPTAHRLAGRGAIRLADLADDSWIESSGGRPTVLQQAARSAGFDPSMGHEVREWTAKLGFVAAGLGVTVVPGLLRTHLPSTVVAVEVPDLGARRVHLATTPETPEVVTGVLLPVLRRLVS